MVPSYLKTFRQAIRKPESYEINEINEIRGTVQGLNSFNSFNSFPTPPDLNLHNPSRDGAGDLACQASFDALERRCPDFVPSARWQQAVEDGRRFVTHWGEQAEALGWSPANLFGLHNPPKKPAPSYRRLSRYDQMGLLWFTLGRPIVELTATEAIIGCHSGASLKFYRRTEPAPGAIDAEGARP
jgi:hypothetical protein